jgi:hypothetical protein
MLIICPGIHSPKLTEQFIQSIQNRVEQDFLVLPTEYSPYSAIAVYQWLERQGIPQAEPLSFVAFSAGVVGSFGAAWAWQLKGGPVSYTHLTLPTNGW